MAPRTGRPSSRPNGKRTDLLKHPRGKRLSGASQRPGEEFRALVRLLRAWAPRPATSALSRRRGGGKVTYSG